MATEDAIVSAAYAEALERYGHFAAGRPHEYGSIEATTAAGTRLRLTLPGDEVFEDVAPRLVRLAADQPIRLLTVISQRERGAALALLAAGRGRLEIVARSPAIGKAMRWLNPVAALDLDGDGIGEIAAVITPHIGGTLKIYRHRASHLEEIAALGGFSNHVYGSPELGMAIAFADRGRTRLLVPDTTRSSMRIIEFVDDRLRERGRCTLSAPLVGATVAVGGGFIEVTQQDGKRRLKPAACEY